MGISKANIIKKLIYNSPHPSQTLPTSSLLSQWKVPPSMQQYKWNTESSVLFISYSYTLSNTLFSLKHCTYYYHFYVYLEQHPWSSYYHLCPRHCIIHLTSPSPVCLSQLKPKQHLKNYKSSHITISPSSSSSLLMNSNCSYMKTKSFCSSHLKGYFHREAFLSSQPRSMPLHTPT